MLCPVCNGMQSIQLACPTCSNTMEDGGKLTDRFGPYAPYVPHDEEELSLSSRAGAAEETCSHIATCPSCGGWHEVRVVVLG
jgi:hypothetical protein